MHERWFDGEESREENARGETEIVQATAKAR